MNYLNLSTQMMGEDIPTEADSIEIGVWVRLTLYSIDQENGGVIVGCKVWTDRKWLKVARVTLDDVSISSGLWSWQGDDLHLWNYPADKQALVRQRRESGKRGGSARTEAKKEAAKINGAKSDGPKQNPSRTQAKDDDYLDEPKQNPSTTQAQTQQKQKEKQNGNGKQKDKYSLSYQSSLADERERDWEKVWSAFPKRVDEIKCKKLFLEHTVSAQRVIDALTDWSATDEWTRDSGRYIPLPARWLERAGWNETPVQIASKQKEPVRCTL